MKIYLVEDEKDLSSIISKYLIKEGFDVEVFESGEEAIKKAADKVDLWILDIMLTGEISGYDLIKKIKVDNPRTSVIFTSARDQDLDKILGLELGSDDYLAKPYSPKELILRVKAILKRQNLGNYEYIVYEEYDINVDKRIVKNESKEIELTNKEFELLLFFLKNRGDAFDRKEIIDAVWGIDYNGTGRVVDDLLRRLRQKMPSFKIETIYGYGYRLL